MADDAPRETERQRRLACCQSEPPCVLCPLLPQNAGRSLKELALAGLRANVADALDADATASAPTDSPDA